MKEYTVEINGIEHALLLEEEDQKARFPDAKPTGNKVEDTGVDASGGAKAEERPANKESAKPANK